MKTDSSYTYSGRKMDKLVLENVYKNYGAVEAVKDLSLSVKDREFLSIVGPS